MIVFSVFVEPVLRYIPEFPRVVSVWDSEAPAKLAAESEQERLRAAGGDTVPAGFVWHGDDADLWINGAVWSASLSHPDSDECACRVVVQRIEVNVPSKG